MPVITEKVSTGARSEMVEITRLIERRVQDAVGSGYVIVYIPHTTAGITIQENADPDVKHDLLRKLDELVPKREAYYQHAEM